MWEQQASWYKPSKKCHLQCTTCLRYPSARQWHCPCGVAWLTCPTHRGVGFRCRGTDIRRDMSKPKLRNPPRDFWERSRKRHRTLEFPQSHSVCPLPARRMPRRARDVADDVPSKKVVSRRVSRPKRPLHELSASHLYVGSVDTHAPHSTSSTAIVSSSSSTTYLQIKRAKTGSTAAAIGVLVLLGPKLAGNFLKRHADIA